MSTNIHSNKFKRQSIPDIKITEDFGELMEHESNDIKEGSIIKGVITAIDKTKGIVTIDVGLKSEGTIQLSEFKVLNSDESVSVGDEVDVFIESFETRSGLIILSRERAIRDKAWHKFKDIYEKGLNIEGTIIGKVKGGFAVDIGGLVAFLPGSQIDVRPISDLSVIMHVPQPFRILKMDDKQGNLVVSRKLIMEESLREERNEILSTIKQGMVVKGTIKNITDYGAFVSIHCVDDDEKRGPLDGLLHKTDIAWEKVEHPSSIFTIGQTLDLKVVHYNPETQRISLGLKQLLPNPWENIKDEYYIGRRCKGNVVAMVDYGVFISLAPNIDGLVYHTEISWTAKNVHPRKLLQMGDAVEVVVIDVDIEKHRISLSIKRCTENPWEMMQRICPVGTKINVIVRTVCDFGIFVAREEEKDAEYPVNILIPSTELTWTLRGNEALKAYQVGDKIECIITNIDIQYERVTASVRNLHEDTSEIEAEKMIGAPSLIGIVKAVKREGIEVMIGQIQIYIEQDQLPEGKALQDINVGESIECKALSFDRERREYRGSARL